MPMIHDLSKLLRVKGYELNAKGQHGNEKPFDGQVYIIEYDGDGVTLHIDESDPSVVYLSCHNNTKVEFFDNRVLCYEGDAMICLLQLIKVDDIEPSILELLA